MRRTGYPVDVSVRIYSWLLAAYPGRFRAEYGIHMAQVFRDVCRRDYRRRGLRGMAALWARTSLDLARTTVEEHLQRDTHMNRQTWIRLSGWGLVLGGVMSTLWIILTILEPYFYLRPFSYLRLWTWDIWDSSLLLLTGWVVAPVLVSLGMLGLRARYGARAGSLGRAILLLGAIGGFVIPATAVGQTAATTEAMETFFWEVFTFAFVMMYTCLAAFGVVALRRNVLQRWNLLPVVAGIWVPLLFVVGPSLTSSDQPSIHFTAVAGLIVMTIALGLLGYVLQSDMKSEATPAGAIP